MIIIDSLESMGLHPSHRYSESIYSNNYAVKMAHSEFLIPNRRTLPSHHSPEQNGLETGHSQLKLEANSSTLRDKELFKRENKI